jgi:hypothetical protein
VFAKDKLVTRTRSDRVSYPPERLKRFGEWAAEQDSSFSLEDRISLVSDATALSKAGLGQTSSALDLIAALKDNNECEYIFFECNIYTLI